MSMIRLEFPTETREQEAMDFIQEFFNHKENMVPGSYKLDMGKYSYREWLELMRKNANRELADPRFGVSETFFAIDERDEIVGIINYRHEITEFYQNSGQVGYSVRPSQRRQGYAGQMLHTIVDLAKSQGQKQLLLVCLQENEASVRTIRKNGGILVRCFQKENHEYEEYKISL